MSNPVPLPWIGPPRVASDAIKRVTFGTEDAAFAIVWKSLQARVARGAIDSRAKRLFSAGILNLGLPFGRNYHAALRCFVYTQ